MITRSGSAATIAPAMPIYEFECEECGARFEELTSVGARPACPTCGSRQTKRRYSAQAPMSRLVKSRGDARKQEAKNAQLHAKAKSDFKAKRQRARAAKQAQKGGGGSG